MHTASLTLTEPLFTHSDLAVPPSSSLPALPAGPENSFQAPIHPKGVLSETASVKSLPVPSNYQPICEERRENVYFGAV